MTVFSDFGPTMCAAMRTPVGTAPGGDKTVTLDQSAAGHWSFLRIRLVADNIHAHTPGEGVRESP